SSLAVGLDRPPGSKMEPVNLPLLDAENEVFHHARLAVVVALLVQVNVTAAVSNLGHKFGGSNQVVVLVRLRLAAPCGQDPQGQVRLRLLVLIEDCGGVVQSLDPGSRRLVAPEQATKFQAMNAMRRPERRGHLDPSSNEFRLDILWIGSVAAVELRLF